MCAVSNVSGGGIDGSSFGRLIGVVVSGARASYVPVRIVRDVLDFVRDEMLALIEDVEEGKVYLGIVKGSVKRDLALDADALPTSFDPRSDPRYSAPYMTAYIDVIGELVNGRLEQSFSVPRPGSLVYAVEKGHELAKYLGLSSESGLFIGTHKFSGLEVFVNPEALKYHIAVVGATGTGKSRLVKALIEEIYDKTDYSIVVFDHTGVDYADPERWGGREVKVVDASKIVLYPDTIAEVLIERLGLSTGYYMDYIYGGVLHYITNAVKKQHISGANLFGSSTRQGSGLSISEVLEKYKEMCRNGAFTWSYKEFVDDLGSYMSSLNAKPQTITKVKLLFEMRIGRDFFESYLNGRSVVLDDIVDELLSHRYKLVIIDMSKEVEYEAKRSIVYQTLKLVWDKILSEGRKAKVVAVIDEAHNYACARGCEPCSSMIARTAREGRKWEFGLILASQRVIDFAPEIRNNVNTIFFSRVQSASDYQELKNWVEGVPYIEYTLPMLAPREFFFTGLGNPLKKPLLVRVRDVA